MSQFKSVEHAEVVGYDINSCLMACPDPIEYERLNKLLAEANDYIKEHDNSGRQSRSYPIYADHPF